MHLSIFTAAGISKCFQGIVLLTNYTSVIHHCDANTQHAIFLHHHLRTTLSFFVCCELTRSGCGCAPCYIWEGWVRLWGPAGPPAPSRPPDIPDISAAGVGTSSAVGEQKQQQGFKLSPRISRHVTTQICCYWASRLTSGSFKGTLNIKLKMQLPTRLTMAVHAASIMSVWYSHFDLTWAGRVNVTVLLL